MAPLPSTPPSHRKSSFPSTPPRICPTCRSRLKDEVTRDLHYFQDHMLHVSTQPHPQRLAYDDAGNFDRPLGEGRHVLEEERLTREPRSIGDEEKRTGEEGGARKKGDGKDKVGRWKRSPGEGSERQASLPGQKRKDYILVKKKNVGDKAELGRPEDVVEEDEEGDKRKKKQSDKSEQNEGAGFCCCPKFW